MPTTLRNTDILFNDGTTQGTAAIGSESFIAGTTFFPALGATTTPNDGATTTLVKKFDTVMPLPGTFKFRSIVRNNNNGAEVSATIFMRVYKNGVAQGTEVSSGTLATNTNGTCITGDIAIAAGDVISFYFRASTTNINVVYGIIGVAMGVNSSSALNAIVQTAQF
jgi:hypothetical protein